MDKPHSLRAALTEAVPEFQRNPAKMILNVTGGQIAARLTPALGWEYRYTLQLTVLEFSGHVDSLFFPVLQWLRTNETALFDNPDLFNQAVKFQADIIDRDQTDIEITIDLTEAVDVEAVAGGKHKMTHRAEPALAGFEDFEDLFPTLEP